LVVFAIFLLLFLSVFEIRAHQYLIICLLCVTKEPWLKEVAK
jgi:hypothetical protein